MQGRARLPGGRAGRDAGAAAEPLGLALLQPPAASAKPVTAPRLPPSTTTGPPSANQTQAARAPGHRRGPKEKGSASHSFPDSRHLIWDVLGVSGPSGEESSPPPPPSSAAPTPEKREGEETFKSPSSRRSSPGPYQTPQRLWSVVAASPSKP